MQELKDRKKILFNFFSRLILPSIISIAILGLGLYLFSKGFAYVIDNYIAIPLKFQRVPEIMLMVFLGFVLGWRGNDLYTSVKNEKERHKTLDQSEK